MWRRNLVASCSLKERNCSLLLERVAGSPRDTEHMVICFGALVMLVNVLVVYLDNAVYKSGPVWRTENTAIIRVLQIVQFATPLGDWFLRSAPRFLLLFSGFFAYQLEAFGWVLVLVPHSFLGGFPRLAGVALYMSLHFGIWIFMAIGHFPPLCIAMWCMFLPSCFWNMLPRSCVNCDLYPTPHELGRSVTNSDAYHSTRSSSRAGSRVMSSWVPVRVREWLVPDLVSFATGEQDGAWAGDGGSVLSQEDVGKEVAAGDVRCQCGGLVVIFSGALAWMNPMQLISWVRHFLDSAIHFFHGTHLNKSLNRKP